MAGVPAPARATPAAAGVDYDIVYVRYPRDADTTNVLLPMGELPDGIEPGADLVLLHPDGTRDILVGCRDTPGYQSYQAEANEVDARGVPASAWPSCSVQDPSVSFNGQWVYYTKYLNVNAPARGLATDAFLFKMRIAGPQPERVEVQLTSGASRFTHDRYGGNTFPGDDIPMGIRDLGATPLPGGDIVFTSNRSGLVPPRQGTLQHLTKPTDLLAAQLYRMSDHDGASPNKDLRAVGHSNLHLVQHPFMLRDGRLLLSNWDDAGVKQKYALLTLYAVHPDGSDLKMFMEPHDYHKRLDHFGTQIASGDVVVTSYYPGNVWGFGTLLRMPAVNPDPAFQQAQLPAQEHYRAYARIGTVNMTPHTDGADVAAPGNSGRYSMPAAAPRGGMLVAFSPGPVIGGGPGGVKYPLLDAGVYLIAGAASAVITNPSTQLAVLHNDPAFNEIWPRPVVPYAAIHALPAPLEIPDTANDGGADARLPLGTPFGLIGTSSLYNRESANLAADKFDNGTQRETPPGAWTVQGAQAGLVNNADIYGARILVSVPKPYLSPYLATAYERTVQFDNRLDNHVEGFVSHSSERWKILGEFPVRKTSGGAPVCNPNEPLLKRDALGRVNPADLYAAVPDGPCGLLSPDTSFLARIPADTPFLIQGIDADGMTLFTEQTWRHLAPGEVRSDCGGCHGHAIPAVPFAGTQADQPGYAVWDLAARTPYVTRDGAGNPVVAYRTNAQGQDVGLWDIEFTRDIKPILDTRCLSCHTAQNNTTGTDLVFDDPTYGAYWRLAHDSAPLFGGAPPAGQGGYHAPQMSKYIRAFQARESLLVWKLFGRRLDGRANVSRADDLDYAGAAMPPPGAPQLTDEQKRLIARWVDLGAPADLPGRARNRYTDDDLLPVVALASPLRGANALSWNRVVLGLYDGESGLDMATLRVTLGFDVPGYPAGANLAPLAVAGAGGVWTITLPGAPFPADTGLVMNVRIADRAGNEQREQRHFLLTTRPRVPRNVAVISGY
ncbi:MAG: hypothetical protein HZA24_02135 [Nitrospirae bacterium]|nr:hypothetical protein [Nitrospirota bacterium]